jgi:hypothetical protein
MSIARDGSGGLVYLKKVGGVQHVFVSRLLGGVFQSPQLLDGALGAPSSEPVVAAGNGGVLLVAFVNAGTLYVADAAGSSAPFSGPIQLSSGVSGAPSIDMSDFGKAYLAFAASGDGGSDVRGAYYYKGAWALAAAPLNATPGDDAGTGTGGPSVATAGDGIATVVWGERGHIYSRRVWGTQPSLVDEQADVASVSGWSEVSATQPQAAAGGNSSYVDVAFDETLTDGHTQQTRVLLNRLQGSQYNGIVELDGLSTPGTMSAGDPRVAVGEYGQGLVTSSQQGSKQLFAGQLGQNGYFVSASRIDSLPNSSAPHAVPASAGPSSLIVAWQEDLGTVGGTSIRTRFYMANTTSFGPEVSLSGGAAGATNAAAGLLAAGDVRGDAAVAWAQGTGAGTEVVAAQLYQPPGTPVALQALRYVRTTQPVLSWSSAEPWGPVRYAVTLDGVPIATTMATSLAVPAPLGQGPHIWQLTASNPVGFQASGNPAEIFVDTLAPALRLKLKGMRTAGSPIQLDARYSDARHGASRADASGVASVTIRWGDGSLSRLRPGSHHALHTYKRGGHYRLSVSVVDRAGNRKTVTRPISVA